MTAAACSCCARPLTDKDTHADVVRGICIGCADCDPAKKCRVEIARESYERGRAVGLREGAERERVRILADLVAYQNGEQAVEERSPMGGEWPKAFLAGLGAAIQRIERGDHLRPSGGGK